MPQASSVNSEKKRNIKFRYEGKDQATYVESSLFSFRRKHQTEIRQNGKRAKNVFASKLYFLTHSNAQVQRTTLETNISCSRNRYIKDIRDYRVRVFLEKVEQKELSTNKEVTNQFQQEADDWFYYNISSFTKEKIIGETQEDLALRDLFNAIISKKKLQRLDRSDKKTILFLLIEESKTPKAMAFINIFMKHLLSKKHIKQKEYLAIRKAFKDKVKHELEKILNKVKQDKEQNTGVFDNNKDMCDALYKIIGYNKIVTESRHKHKYFKRFMTSTEKLISLSNKTTLDLLDIAQEKIQKSPNPSTLHNLYIDTFLEVGKVLELVILILKEPIILQSIEINLAYYFEDISNKFIRLLKDKHLFFIETTSSLEIIKKILLESKELNKKNSSYKDIGCILQKKYPKIAEQINDKLNKYKDNQEISDKHLRVEELVELMNQVDDPNNTNDKEPIKFDNIANFGVLKQVLCDVVSYDS